MAILKISALLCVLFTLSDGDSTKNVTRDDFSQLSELHTPSSPIEDSTIHVIGDDFSQLPELHTHSSPIEDSTIHVIGDDFSQLPELHTHSSPIEVSTKCVRKLKENVDFPGSDILQIYSPDVHHCQLACTQHHSCLFFTFVRPDWTRDSRKFYCYLKHTDSGKPSRVKKVKKVTSGYSLKSCEEREDVCLSRIYKEVDFTGADYRSLFTMDYEECQRACNSDPGCQFFSFLTEDFPKSEYRGKCHLKYSWATSTPPIIKVLNGVVSGFSHDRFWTDKPACQEKILTHTDFPGNDYEQVPAASAEHCQFLCTAHPRCSYFSYATSNYSTDEVKMRCFLKDNLVKKPSLSVYQVHSGMPTRFCEPSNDWMTTRFENVDFLGSDNRYVVMDNPESCQEMCTADPYCRFYTYVYNSFHRKDYRRRCFLKQVITIPVPPKVVSMKGVVSGFSMRKCYFGA